MKRQLIAAFALAALALPVAASAAGDSVGAMSIRSNAMKVASGTRHNWGARSSGRWIGGLRAPGGYGGYRPAFRGFVLPSYWINPSYYIADYGRYGFSVPQSGYGWSRYYDDAVLTDRYGRVYDSVRDVDWDRYDGYDDSGYEEFYDEDYADSYGYRDDRRAVDRRGRDRDGGLGGAAIGGVAGALTGAIIAKKGSSVAGGLIGGGLGALAGAAIDSSDRAGRGPKVRKLSKSERRRLEREREYDYAYGRDYARGSRRPGANYDGRWQGEWRGSYDGGQQRVYRGTYDGEYRGTASHWGGGSHVVQHGGYGYGGGETIVTVQSQPVVTTTSVTTEEVVYAEAPVRTRYAPRKKVWRPRPKPRCACQ